MPPSQRSIPLTRRIARFARGASANLRDDAAGEVVLRSIVDSLACLVGATDGNAVAIARDVAQSFNAVSDSTVPGATLVGGDRAVSLEAAAFVNGIAVRYLDYNDIYLSTEAVHPSDVNSVAFALAEALGVDGRRLVDAVAVGYEVHCRMADAMSTRARGWDHALLNAVASAVTAGVLLDLDEDPLTNAVAIAATGNVATMETRVGALSMWKAAAAPYAARAGLFAALHAGRGMTGPEGAVDGKHGLLAQVTGRTDAAAFDAALEATSGPPRLLGVHLKAYPIGYFTQPAVDAALQLRARVEPDRVERIEIETTAFGLLANADGPAKWNPGSRETADHSLPYGVAVALLDGRVGERQFALERITAPDVRGLMSRISVRENDAFTGSYPERVATRISITLADGRSCACQVDYPRGHARNPMSRAEVEAKLADLASQPCDDVLGELWNLPLLSPPQLRGVLRRTMALGCSKT